jgi:hypothetical protein
MCEVGPQLVLRGHLQCRFQNEDAALRGVARSEVVATISEGQRVAVGCASHMFVPHQFKIEVRGLVCVCDCVCVCVLGRERERASSVAGRDFRRIRAGEKRVCGCGRGGVHKRGSWKGGATDEATQRRDRTRGATKESHAPRQALPRALASSCVGPSTILDDELKSQRL